MLGGYEEAVPGLAVFLVWPDLTGLEAGFGEHERSRKVVPQCVAHEVEFVQFIQGVVRTCPANEARGVARSSTTTPLASSIHTRSGVKCPVRASPPNGVIVTIGR